MKLNCPSCSRSLPLDDVNVARDVILCRTCARTFSFADLLAGSIGPGREVDPANPPRGAWYLPTFDGFEVGASTRSPFALFIVPFMCVWSCCSLGGIYGRQIAAGRIELRLSLFGIPVVLGTLVFGCVAVMSACGKVVVSISGDEGKVFTGVGPIGWTRRFAWSSVATVVEFLKRVARNRQAPALALEGANRLVFGTGLNEPRRYFLREVLRQKLRERGARSKPTTTGDWSS